MGGSSLQGPRHRAILSFWTDDAKVIQPDLPVVQGKQALRDYVKQSLKIPGFRITWSSTDASFSPDGKLAYLTGTNSVTMDGPDGSPVNSDGRVITVCERKPMASGGAPLTFGTPALRLTRQSGNRTKWKRNSEKGARQPRKQGAFYLRKQEFRATARVDETASEPNLEGRGGSSSLPGATNSRRHVQLGRGDKMKLDPSEVVRRFWVSVWTEGKADLLSEIFDPDIRENGEAVDVEDFKRAVISWRRVFPDFTATRRTMLLEFRPS